MAKKKSVLSAVAAARSAAPGRRIGAQRNFSSGEARKFNAGFKKTGNISYAKGTSRAFSRVMTASVKSGDRLQTAFNKGMTNATAAYSGSKNRRVGQRRGGIENRRT